MTEVIMPKMGDAMEEGTLVEWLKREGDQVKSGEVIGTIQTDKATLELESPGSGVLSGVLIKNGDTVPVGKPIAAVLKSGEALPAGWGGSQAAGREQAAAPRQHAQKAPAAQEQSAAALMPTGGGATEGTKTQAITAGVGQESSSGMRHALGESDRVKASPLAKRIAAERGINLAAVQGTGPGGRIVEKDITSSSPTTSSTGAPSAPSFVPIAATAEDQVIQLNKLRQITAQRTAQAKQQVPHFYVTLWVDVESLMSLREQFEAEGSGKISINDFVMRACVLALREMPNVNATFQGTSVLQHGAIHMGMAVAIDAGLTVPVIKNAHAMSLRQLSAKAKELATKARENKLHPDELSGSTFTISNMGMLNVDEFIAIINEPNAAILAVSSVRKQVVASDEDDEISIRRRMSISGSFDHRVVDGAIGAKFMNAVREYLEHPTRLLS